MSDADVVIPATAPTDPAVVIETAGGVIPRAVSSRLLTHGGITIPHFFAMHVTGAGFPLVAGLLLYGWRALGSIAIVLASAAIAVSLWKRIGKRGEQLRYSHTLWLAMLLALTLPPHLMTDNYRLTPEVTIETWPILPAAGLIIVPLIWLLGGLGSGRLHPVIIANLILTGFFPLLLLPHFSLQRGKIFLGDVMDVGKSDEAEIPRGPWIHAPPIPGRDAVRVEQPASQRLILYTSPRRAPARAYMSLEALLRDAMPPLEDLILGGHPGSIGTSCAIAVIIGGLFMLYRGVIDYRIPLLTILCCYIALLLLPVPVAIRETTRLWQWTPMRHASIGPALAVTFANYEIMASPLLFMAFFLATSTALRPLARRARTIYAILLGFITGVLQLYVSVSVGAYLALLLAGAIAPALDRFFRPRTLV